ncbi:phenylacetate--CoA ligase family protein [Azoarcus taiwanensis]|uniref:AMP-binding protein n=1 Tax=Azoarcus taiwanensis TaxID=666964 RepID=A0A972F9D3_9RHOO|nr:AMP-binding protein [Azoarcus taiwanensis]NMG04542.1 AMP-binding protein [Azoarcus taiwanensis]
MKHYDTRETRDPQQRERDLLTRLPAQIAHAKANAPAFAKLLAEVDPESVTTREALAGLPVIRKSELLELQKAARPFGGFAAVKWGRDCRRVFASPGPLYEPESARIDYYRLARALFAAGFREGDLVHNTFSYHFTPAGSMMETAAHALGCTVFPAGVGQTEQQVAAIADLAPNAYTGTPSFLRIILDKADELGVKSSFTKAFVSGEAFPPSVRDAFAARGISAYQAYATADIGLIAYETEAREGLIADEDVIIEIVRPGTGDPVGEGEVGEVVVTTLNPDYPLIRFGTGDLSAVLAGASPCGRTNVRIKGWMGRADQTTKIKGMFVHPGQVAAVVKRHPEILRARLIVDNPDLNDRMTLHCETAHGDNGLAVEVAASIRELTKLRGEVSFVAPGSLANDGKVIDDIRKYD